MKLRFSLIVAATLICSAFCHAQIFYKISGNGLEKPSYLFGTHHLAPLSTIDSVAGVRPAFTDCTAVVGEIDMTVPQMQLAMAMQPFMMAPSDSLLTDVIEPEVFKRINEKFKSLAIMPGLDLNALAMMRPMVPSSMVSVTVIKKLMPGFNENEQLDKYFQEQGKKEGKSVIPLETPELQAKLLYTFAPIKEQAKNLVELLDNTEEVAKKAAELNDLYKSQDLNGMLLLSEEESKGENTAFMTALLDQRNASWLEKLPQIMKANPTFIAVGALHLAGEKGLVESLRKAGYTVEAIKK